MRPWLEQVLQVFPRPSGLPPQYRELIAPLPIPTAEQTENFATYLVEVRSWYKHLPCDPPGAPFVVFLDPNAGRSLFIADDGGAEYRDCPDERDGFRYTGMPTAEYLTKFGHWEYANAINPAQVDPLGFALVRAVDGASIEVSPEVVAAGTVFLTAYIHAGFAHLSAPYFSEVDRQIEAEHARQCAELRAALHRVRSLLTRGK